MYRVSVTIALVLVLAVASALPVWAGGPVDAALVYLAAQQRADGGFSGGFGGGSDLGLTCDVILAAAAGGQDVGAWVSNSGKSPLDYLHAQVARGAAAQSGMKAKVVMALLATPVVNTQMIFYQQHEGQGGDGAAGHRPGSDRLRRA